MAFRSSLGTASFAVASYPAVASSPAVRSMAVASSCKGSKDTDPFPSGASGAATSSLACPDLASASCWLVELPFAWWPLLSSTFFANLGLVYCLIFDPFVGLVASSIILFVTQGPLFATRSFVDSERFAKVVAGALGTCSHLNS